MSRLIWKFLSFFLAVNLFVTFAHATDEFCGVDTDFNGTVDNPCPEPDKDNDLYPSSNAWTGPYGAGVVDCDDTDFWIHPGFETIVGCSAGQYRTCQADGTYTACANISAFTCHTGSGKTVWYDNAGVTTGGCGTTYATPCSWACLSDDALACYDLSDAGDCHVYQAGSYSGSWDDAGTARQFYQNNRDGTLTNPIIFRGEPGAIPGYANAAKFNGAGTSPTEVQLVRWIDSNYVRMFSIEMDGTSDYSNAGIWIAGGTNPIFVKNYIHHINGESNNNLSGVKCSNTTIGCEVRQSFFKENCEVGSCTDQNSVDVTIMDDTGVVVLNNNILFGQRNGARLRIKHGNDTSTPTISNNFMIAADQYAIGSENKDTTAKNNWIKDCTTYAIRYGGIGGTTGWWKNSVFSLNTLQGCALVDIKTDWDDSTGHASYSGTTVFTADGNIVSDDQATYGGDEENGVTRMCEYNCVSGEFAAASGKAIWSNNVYYSSGTSSLRFGYFGQAGGGADYAGLTAWKAAGFDVGSVQADPGLDADGISATYPTKGWRAGVFTAAGPTPTPTPAPSGGGGFVPWFE